MAVVTMNLVNHKPVRSARLAEYFVCLEFDTNNTSAPDGLSPALSGVTLGRTGVGDLTVTFAESDKPLAVHFASVQIEGDEKDMFAKVTGYTPATGVLTLTTYTNSAGTISPADTTDKKLKLLLVCTRSDKS